MIELRGIDESLMKFLIPVVLIQAVLIGFAVGCWQLLFKLRRRYVPLALTTSILVSAGVLLLSVIAMVVIPLAAQFAKDFNGSGVGGIVAAIVVFCILLPCNVWMIAFVVMLWRWSRKLKCFDMFWCLKCQYNIGPTIESGRVMCPECGAPILEAQITANPTNM